MAWKQRINMTIAKKKKNATNAQVGCYLRERKNKRKIWSKQAIFIYSVLLIRTSHNFFHYFPSALFLRLFRSHSCISITFDPPNDCRNCWHLVITSHFFFLSHGVNRFLSEIILSCLSLSLSVSFNDFFDFIFGDFCKKKDA